MALKVWGGGSGPVDGNWDTGTNWTGDTIPANGDDVLFDGTANDNLVNTPSSPVTLLSFTATLGYSGVLNLTNPDLSVSGTVDIQSGFDSVPCRITLVDASSVNITSGHEISFGTGSSILDATVTISSCPVSMADGPLLCKGENIITIDGSPLSSGFNFRNTLEQIDHASNGGVSTKNWSGGDNWIGQTFTLASPTDISCVRLDNPLADIRSREQFRLEIYNTSAGLPTGAPIAQSDDFILNRKCGGAFAYFFFTAGYLNLAAGTYAFVLRPLSGFGLPVQIVYDATNAYAGGTFVQSVNGGASWSSVAGEDLAFAILDLSLTSISTTDNLGFGNEVFQKLLEVEAVDFTVASIGGPVTNINASPSTIVVYRNFICPSITIQEDTVNFTYFDLTITLHEAFNLTTHSISINGTNYLPTRNQVDINSLASSYGGFSGDLTVLQGGRIIVEGSDTLEAAINSGETIYFDSSVHKAAAVSLSGTVLTANSFDGFILKNQRIGGAF